MRVLIVDGANVVGSRPDGWWHNRAGAAAQLHATLARADLDHDAVVLVLEGAARRGQPPGEADGILCVHAHGEGDDAIVEEVRAWRATGAAVEVVTADRRLRQRVTAAGGESIGPSWLWGRLTRP
ncbi:MAG: hypothetical protein ACQERF_08030 [Actinomycetota bacterium]